MKNLVIKGLSLAGVLLLAPASFGANFGGITLLGGWPVSSCGASADWSSDLGIDYRLNIGDNGSGEMAASGDGKFQFSRSVAASDAGFNLSYRLNPKGGEAGYTYSDGSMSIPSAGELSPGKVSTFNLHGRLGENADNYGISTGAFMNHYFSIAADYKGQPIYWRMEWTVTLKTSATTVNAFINGIGGLNTIVQGEHVGLTVFSGSSSGQWSQYPYDSVGTYPPIQLGTSIGDGSEQSGVGDIWMKVRVAFSTTPFSSIPASTSLIAKNGAGEVRKLMYSGPKLSSSERIASLPAGMDVIGCGDFDQNGSPDLVVRGDSDGAGPLGIRTLLWLYEGRQKVRVVRLPNIAATYTESLNSADLDRDGNLELIVWSPSTQRARAFEIPRDELALSTVISSYQSATTLPYHATYSTILGLGDFNADGWTDLVVQDPTTGTLKYRYMVGTTVTSISAPLTANGGSSSFLGVGRLFDGRLGLLVDTPDGVLPRTFWDMDGTSRLLVADLLSDQTYRSWTVFAVDY